MSQLSQLNQETIDLTRKVFRNEIEKAITVSGTGLVGYNLEAPSKKLYPVVTPLRNRIPRTGAPVGATAANWKAITGINTAKLKAAVSFGTRNAATISYTSVAKSASYKSYGLDDSVEDEAQWMGRKFEDVRAYSALALLQSLMIEEEKLLLGGLSTANTLGTPGTVTPTKITADTGTFAGATNFVEAKVVALPLYGWVNSDPADLTSLSADHSAASAKASIQLAATTDSVSFVLGTAVNGALAYAWFCNEKAAATSTDTELRLAAITTVPAFRMRGPVAGGNLTLTAAVNADQSGDANAFDGLLPQLLNPNVTLATLDATSYTNGVLKIGSGGTGATNTIVLDMNYAAGAAGAQVATAASTFGMPLTSDGAGGIVEFDAVFKAMWDRQKIGPTLALINSQESLSITKIIGGSASGLGWKMEIRPGVDNKGLTGGMWVGGYINKFTGYSTPGMPDIVPFMMHPNVPPGTVVFLTERLPYPTNEVASVFEMEMIQEYADFEWARTQRKYEHGVYANGALKVYFPAGQAIIRNIRPS